jgi:hypothetical protein
MKQIHSITTKLSVEDKDSVKTEYLEYDENNNLLLSTKFDTEDGEIIEKTEFNYDSNGNKIHEKHYISKDEIAEDRTLVYNESKKLSEIKTIYSEGYESLTKHEYDENNRELTVKEVDENGEIEETHIRKFNEKGQLIERTEYDDNKKFVNRTSYAFDEQDKIAEETEYEKNTKKPISIKQYEYDEIGNISKVLMRNYKGKLISQYRMNYDDQNRLIRQISQGGIIEIDYPEENIKIERVLDAAGNPQEETSYRYDENKNLIQEKSSMQTTDYTIEYY